MTIPWRGCVAVAVLFLGLSALAHAQTASSATQGQGRGYRAQGYVFFGPGVTVASGYHQGKAHIGAGVEALAYKGLGVGTELGYYTPWRDWSAGWCIFSLDGSYHFLRNQKVSPFLTGGLSLGFGRGFVDPPYINFGGGVNYWFPNGAGIRLEFRDHLNRRSWGDYHYLSARIGFTFR